MDDYGNINTASLGTEYLMTNATTHSFIFGAMAELVDNARDALATTLEIYTAEGDDESCSPLLCFKDNGCGMTKEEAENVIVFGSSRKTDQEEPIGMYGNGLKSGSMRLGKDMVLFTKKDGVMTCLMISRTFYQAENVTQIKVPVPSFDAKTKNMIGSDKRKHATEVSLMTKYSPFRDEQTLLAQFDAITGKSGTIIMVYNLSTTPTGDLELDFLSDADDIRTTLQLDHENEQEVSDVIERRSFRAYASILYKSPRMKIILQNKRVRTRLLAYSLYLPKRIQVAYKSFKNQSEKQINEAKKQIEVAKRKLIEVQSQISQANKSTGITNKQQMITVRKLAVVESELKQQVNEKKGIMELRKKQSKKSEQLEFYFGLNANERYHDGMFFYNADRLIKMYVKEGTLQSKEEITYRGIIAVVSVPKSSLLPTHNKQDFNDHAEYKKLRKCVDQAMMQYWEEVVMGEWSKQGLGNGWAELGYTQDWRKPPSEEETYKIRRARMVKHMQQCDKCLKWRVIPYHKNYLYKDFPDNWQCSDSLDPSSNSCTKSEVLPKIDSAALKHKSQLKQPDPPAKREAPKKTMSAARQEQQRMEERKRKMAEAEEVRQAAQKRSKALIRSPPQAKPSPAPRKPAATATSRASTGSVSTRPGPASRKRDLRDSSPETPPVRQGRRSSPAAQQKTETLTPVTTNKPTAATARRSRVPSNNEPAVAPQTSDETEEESMEVESAPEVETPQTSRNAAMANNIKSKLSNSAVKVETSTPNGKRSGSGTSKKYRMVSIQDIKNGDIAIGDLVQGRYQNKWQEGEVLEVRPDNVLVKLNNKMKLSMKVKNPEKGIDGELRVETEDDDEMGEMAQPSSTTMVEMEPAHHNKLISLVKTFDKSLDVDSLTPSNLAELDVMALLNRYTGKLKKEAASASQSESQKELNVLKAENSRLKTEVNKYKEESAATTKKYERREEERFERIRDLFSRVLTVCIGSGPESEFSTYDQLVELLENIAASLAD